MAVRTLTRSQQPRRRRLRTDPGHCLATLKTVGCLRHRYEDGWMDGWMMVEDEEEEEEE